MSQEEKVIPLLSWAWVVGSQSTLYVQSHHYRYKIIQNFNVHSYNNFKTPENMSNCKNYDIDDIQKIKTKQNSLLYLSTCSFNKTFNDMNVLLRHQIRHLILLH